MHFFSSFIWLLKEIQRGKVTHLLETLVNNSSIYMVLYISLKKTERTNYPSKFQDARNSQLLQPRFKRLLSYIPYFIFMPEESIYTWPYIFALNIFVRLEHL